MAKKKGGVKELTEYSGPRKAGKHGQKGSDYSGARLREDTDNEFDPSKF